MHALDFSWLVLKRQIVGDPDRHIPEAMAGSPAATADMMARDPKKPQPPPEGGDKWDREWFERDLAQWQAEWAEKMKAAQDARKKALAARDQKETQARYAREDRQAAQDHANREGWIGGPGGFPSAEWSNMQDANPEQVRRLLNLYLSAAKEAGPGRQES